MHIQVDIHGNPDGYLGSAGGGPWPFLAAVQRRKKKLPHPFPLLCLNSHLDPELIQLRYHVDTTAATTKKEMVVPSP